MTTSTGLFREFEHKGWSNEDVCKDYDDHFGAVTTQSVSALLDAAGAKQGSRLLDVCTGAGYAAGLAAERGASVIGVDFSVTQVQMAMKRYPNVAFREADGCALPFPNGTFDCVVNSIGIPHFEDPDAAIREAFRVLKCRGKFAFTVYDAPDKAVGFGAIYRAVAEHGTRDIRLPQGPNFFLFSDPVEAKRRLMAGGFRAVSITIVPQTWRPSTTNEMIEAILNGTVRAAATLKGQTSQAWPKIRAAISETLSAYKRGDKYEVPMPAVLVSATKV